MNTSKKYPIVLGLAGVLLAMLVVLAVLQYHWLSQLSQSNAIGMKANLETMASRFTQDVDRAIIQAHMAFLLPSGKNHDEIATALSDRYEQWRTTSLHPQSLKSIYWVENDASGEATLLRLQPEEAKLAAVEWPASLLTWPNWLSPNQTIPSPDAQGHTTSEIISLVPFSGASPMTAANVGFPLPLAGRAPSGLPQYQLMLAFDKSYLTETWLPELVDHHFGSSATMDYDVLVTHRANPNDILYQSSPDLAQADFAATDLSVNMGLPDWAFMMRAMMTMAKDGNLTAMQDLLRFLNPAASDTSTQPAAALSEFLSKRVDPGMRGMMMPVRTWQLHAKPRQGSFDTIVTTLRRRHLAVSFGVLLILAVASALIIVYTSRMRRLADQQMAFVAGVSHDLRTPIAVMHAAGENLQDGLVTDAEETKDYGELIVEESRRLLNTVEQVLAYAGIAFGSERPPDTSVSLNDVVTHVLAGFGTQLDRFDVQLSLADDVPLVEGDREALATALQNLIQNARKYSTTERSIHIETRVSDDIPNEVCVLVRDQGMGIAPSDQARIFEPFYRSDAARTSQTPGNGLGLSIVKSIVEAHNGRITVTSTPGQGTTFTLYLPTVSQPT